jgi:hypothetical protein
VGGPRYQGRGQAEKQDCEEMDPCVHDARLV